MIFSTLSCILIMLRLQQTKDLGIMINDLCIMTASDRDVVADDTEHGAEEPD